jgi:GWxTD domain-containing protein
VARWQSALAPLVLVALAASCSGARGARVSAGARLWLEGPVRWLLTPEETRDFRGLTTHRQVLEFIEAFWRRRDPTPEDPDNPFRLAFVERSAAADRLYAEGARRGSLTDRGRVLILFGPPSILRYRQKAVPVLAPDRPRGKTAAATRWMTQEVWAYLPEDLPASFLELLPEEESRSELAFVFAAEARRTYLLEGVRYCELAAAALVAR